MNRDMYFVETEKKNYNSINDKEHLDLVVRPNCHDESPIVHVWKWTPRGWTEVTEAWR